MSGRIGVQKNSALYRNPVGNVRRLQMPDIHHITESKHYGLHFSFTLDMEEDLSMEPRFDHVNIHNRTTTHWPLIKCRSSYLGLSTGLEEVF
jgi:hypothetical protein